MLVRYYHFVLSPFWAFSIAGIRAVTKFSWRPVSGETLEIPAPTLSYIGYPVKFRDRRIKQNRLGPASAPHAQRGHNADQRYYRSGQEEPPK